MIVRLAVALAIAAALLGASLVRADGANAGDGRAHAESAFRAPVLELSPDGSAWVLSVDFDVPLTPALHDALARGVPLYFAADFEMWRPRWWWWDAEVAAETRTWRLAYHALTRSYRLISDGVIEPFETLDEAVRALSRVRGWRVAPVTALSAGVEYEARVRLRLDNSQLPKPFQVGSLTNREWNPQSEWMNFTFTMATAKSAP